MFTIHIYVLYVRIYIYTYIFSHLVQDLVYQRYVYVKNVEKVGKLHVQNSKKKLNTQIHPFLGKQIIRSFHGPLEWFASPMLWRRMVSSIHGYLDCDEGSLGLRICATRIPGLEKQLREGRKRMEKGPKYKHYKPMRGL